MAEKMLYVHNKYVLQEDYLSQQEIEENKAKTRKIMYIVNKIEKAKARKEASRGICPCCHLMLPYNGICDCGYHK